MLFPLHETSHRPWPLPGGPWIMRQKWHDLLFAHWRVEADGLQRLLPSRLALDLYDGAAWVGVVPFCMSGVRFRWLPPLPWAHRFPELNVRTYVRGGQQERPGVYFFSLDAASLPAVCGARLAFHLPYFWARMWVHHAPENRILYESYRIQRIHPGECKAAEFKATYYPTGGEFTPQPGMLEHFLTERYCLYSTNRKGDVLSCDIHHPPWRLRAAEAEIHLNSMARAAGIDLPSDPPLLYCAAPQDVVVWPLENA
jgi:uncharacterized protein